MDLEVKLKDKNTIFNRVVMGQVLVVSQMILAKRVLVNRNDQKNMSKLKKGHSFNHPCIYPFHPIPSKHPFHYPIHFINSSIYPFCSYFKLTIHPSFLPSISSFYPVIHSIIASLYSILSFHPSIPFHHIIHPTSIHYLSVLPLTNSQTYSISIKGFQYYIIFNFLLIEQTQRPNQMGVIHQALLIVMGSRYCILTCGIRREYCSLQGQYIWKELFSIQNLC